jgi:molybdopterin synthase sulfur carrier subunit
MRIHVKYFASIRETLGVDDEWLETSADTLGALRLELIHREDRYSQALSTDRAVRMALNQILSHDDAILTDGSEVAFFPPVTGG